MHLHQKKSNDRLKNSYAGQQIEQHLSVQDSEIAVTSARRSAQGPIAILPVGYIRLCFDLV